MRPRPDHRPLDCVQDTCGPQEDVNTGDGVIGDRQQLGGLNRRAVDGCVPKDGRCLLARDHLVDPHVSEGGAAGPKHAGYVTGAPGVEGTLNDRVGAERRQRRLGVTDGKRGHVGVDEGPGVPIKEQLVSAGAVAWTIVAATQFHDFAAMVTGWAERDGSAAIAPLLLQPIAPKEVAEILVGIATGPPQGRYRDVAGPETQDLVDMSRRTYAARGRTIRLIPTWSGLFGTAIAGNVLLPGDGARLAPTTFDAWLAEDANGQKERG